MLLLLLWLLPGVNTDAVAPAMPAAPLDVVGCSLLSRNANSSDCGRDKDMIQLLLDQSLAVTHLQL